LITEEKVCQYIDNFQAMFPFKQESHTIYKTYFLSIRTGYIEVYSVFPIMFFGLDFY